FVDDDHLGHVILDSFDHHGVLQVGTRHLHAAAGPDARVGDIAVTANLVGCVDNDDALPEFGRKHACALSQQCRLSDAGTAQEEQAYSGFDDISTNIGGSVDG